MSAPASVDVLAGWRDWTLEQGREALRYCNSYTRLPTLIAIEARLEIQDWLKLLGEEWTLCDNVGLLFDDLTWSDHFGDLMDDPASWRGCFMDDDEADMFATLPDELTIYRGCYALNKWGLSWTTDRAVAERFPMLHRYQQEGQPLLITARVRKADILAVKNGREEAEIVCYRPKHVSTRHIDGARLS